MNPSYLFLFLFFTRTRQTLNQEPGATNIAARIRSKLYVDAICSTKAHPILIVFILPFFLPLHFLQQENNLKWQLDQTNPPLTCLLRHHMSSLKWKQPTKNKLLRTTYIIEFALIITLLDINGV
jgi:hypothetical protein